MKKISMIFLGVILGKLTVFADIAFPDDSSSYAAPVVGQEDLSLYYFSIGIALLCVIAILIFIKKNKKHDS